MKTELASVAKQQGHLPGKLLAGDPLSHNERPVFKYKDKGKIGHCWKSQGRGRIERF